MKKILVGIALATVLGAITFAAAPTAPTIYGPMTWECLYAWNVLTATSPTTYNQSAQTKDTLVGVDSLTFVNRFPLEPGYEYIVQSKDSAGSADSCQLQYTLYGFDNTTAFATNSPIDTLRGQAAAQFKTNTTPFGSTKFGGWVTLRLKKDVATLKMKIYRLELIRRKLATSVAKLF